MSSIVISGDTSGAITLAAPAVSGTNTATLPAATGTVMVSGNMPAFSAYHNTTQSIANNTWTKILFNTKDFDTNNNFASSTFTPTVAGYYQVSANCEWQTTTSTIGLGAFGIYKNGTPYKRGNQFQLAAANNTGYQISLVVYMNGSTDYLEIYMYQNSGGNLTTQNSDNGNAVWFTGVLVRAA